MIDFKLAWEDFPYKDKVYHFGTGAAVGAVMSLINPSLALGIVVVAAVAKEAVDKFVQKEKFDIWDLAYTVAGGVLTTSLINVFWKGLL
jgi:hypothetical protein